MKPVRNILQAVVATTLLAAVACSGQQVSITRLDAASGRLDFTLSPSGTVSNYSCSAEWRSTLGSGSWTNSWYQPFAVFPQSNGMFYAALPRFFRIRCAEGTGQTVAVTNYTVITNVLSSLTSDGLICWTNTGDTSQVYYVELAMTANGAWSGQWNNQTNIHTTSIATNSFGLPLYFRVVTIKPSDSGEVPW